MGARAELIASYWTIAGVFPGGTQEHSRFSFQDRVQAAARAGFSGIGFWHSDLEHVLKTTSLPEMKRILDDNGMRHVEVEFLTDWFLEGERRKHSDERRSLLLNAAEVLQAERVKVGDFSNTPCPFDRLVESFASLCADAERRGTTVAYETMGSATLDTFQDSLRMVEEADAGNGGIILDIWHINDLAMPYEEVSRIRPEFLMGVELNDAAMDAGAIRKDAVDPRRFCGEGSFDIRGFVRSVRKCGYRGAWGVEVIGKALLSMELETVAARAFNTTMAQFDEP